MVPSTLNSPLDRLATIASPVVHARRGAAWEHGGATFGDEVRALAAALAAYGLTPGMSVAVLGAEGYDSLRAELAVLIAGASLFSLDSALSDEIVSRTLAASGVVHAIACDEKQLARILRVRPDMPALDLVLLMKAEASERKPAALVAQTAMQLGATTLAAEPTILTEALAAGEASQALIVVGTDGRLKSFDRGAIVRLAERIGTVIAAAPGRTALSALPRTSVFRLAAGLAATSLDATLLLADPSQRPDSGLDEHPADVILTSPDALERLWSAWRADIAARSWPGRALVGWSLRQGADPARAGWKHRVAELLVLRDLRKKLGGRTMRLNVLRDEKAKSEPRVVSFFEAIGLSVSFHSAEGGAKPGPSIAPAS